MQSEARHERQPPGPERIDTYVRLAMTSPDEDLLQHYFDACARSDRPATHSVSLVEQRWIVKNLEDNPIWQQSWHQMEQVLGHKIPWKLPGINEYTLRTMPKAERSPRRLRYISIAAALFGMVFYGILWAGGQIALPETYAWASITEYETLLDQSTRSTGTDAQSAFSRAAKALLATPESTFGLFPHYDHVHVKTAISHLTDAYSATTDPFQRAELAFFLAKSSLMERDISSAKRWLNHVISLNVADYRFESQRLLDYIEDQSAFRHSPTSTNGAQ